MRFIDVVDSKLEQEGMRADGPANAFVVRRRALITLPHYPGRLPVLPHEHQAIGPRSRPARHASMLAAAFDR